ncbi:hypothetical protein ACTFIZ_004868 [Dictyostelium cf. discoideum]
MQGLACGKFRCHYFKHCICIHLKVNKVIMALRLLFISFNNLRANERNNRSKRINGTFELHQYNITKDYLLKLFISQKGKCNLSTIMLAGELKEEEEVFRISINRINNKE